MHKVAFRVQSKNTKECFYDSNQLEMKPKFLNVFHVHRKEGA